MKKIILLSILMLNLTCWSQSLLLQPDYQRKIEFGYENDLFAGTDRYYSQGINFDFSWKENEFQTKNVSSYWNTGLQHHVYTPSTIKSGSVLKNDRPYAATFSFLIDRFLVDSVKKQVVSYGLEVGRVGPAAKGEEMQTAIHRLTNNFPPLGWQYQLSNGIIFNAHAKAEFQVVAVRDWFNMNLGLDLEIGTFRTGMKTALLIAAGNMKNKRFCFYSKSAWHFVGHDGTLQGALGGKGNTVFIPDTDMKRLVFLEEFGANFVLKNFRLSLNYTIQSKTFLNQLGAFHCWGGIGVQYLLK
jgi:hypothetical protein